MNVLKEKQYNKTHIKTPFVLGATIILGNCLNLTDSNAVNTIYKSFKELEKLYKNSELILPENKGSNKLLDCEVIRYLHYTNRTENNPRYDTVRCLFIEGEPIYKGANFTQRGHIEVCVLNPKMIKSYFLPRPIKDHNPYLNMPFTKTL